LSVICEIIIWKLSLKASWFKVFGKSDGTCLVRYDNEERKGDHRHYGSLEEAYVFSTVEKLTSDFLEDVRKIQAEENL
jgi:hypothetical protein